MKISITKADLLGIVSDRLGYPVTDITIVKPRRDLHLTIEAKVSKDIGFGGGLNQSLVNRGDLKIPTFTQWMDFVRFKGRVPKLELSSFAPTVMS